KDLDRVRRYQRLLFTERFDGQRMRDQATMLFRLGQGLLLPVGVGRLSPAQFDDVGSELTYLLLRDECPEVTVEISPCGGWSTSWILNALRDNECGHLTSFDVIDDSVFKVPPELAKGIRTFHHGDVRQSPHLPERIDFLFMDSDHTAPFAHWYVENVLPRVRSGGVVIVDDVFQPGGPAASGGEGPVILDWLARNGIEYFTAAESQSRATLDALLACKRRLGLESPVVDVQGVNPAIYFTMP
ncbi:MAG: class I SAM-dependent methyltransferase, partial [Planctomycetes bacterium]|nr:class I SAM-dependent methyltransferase [Planctomycetota bacterium]